MTTTNTLLTNEGWIDRTLRAFVGLAFLQLAYFWLGGLWATIFYVLGAILILTAAIGFCPLYKVLGMRTNRVANRGGRGFDCTASGWQLRQQLLLQEILP